jgi:hypothetical protein
VAVNVDLAEADLAPLDAEEMVAAISTAPVAGATPRAGGREMDLRREDQERRQRLWRMLLLTAFLVLIVETVVSNRLSSSTAKRGIHA